MLTINKNQLAAAINCAGVKDIRYYLNGVHIEVTTSGEMYIVSTDGTVMFVGRIEQPTWTDTPQIGPWSMTIPLDTVKAACKAKSNVITLSALPDGRYTLGDTMFAPIDGVFPDWRRVAALLPDSEASTAQFNPDLLSRCTKALATWDNNKNANYFLHHRGESAAAMATDNAFCIVMPIRGNHTIGQDMKPFIPCKL